MNKTLKKLLCNNFLTTGSIRLNKESPIYPYVYASSKENACSISDSICNALGIQPTEELSETDIFNLLRESQETILSKLRGKVKNETMQYVLKERNTVDTTLAKLTAQSPLPLMILEYWRQTNQKYLINKKQRDLIELFANIDPAILQDPNIIASLATYLPNHNYDPSADITVIYGGQIHSPLKDYNPRDIITKIVNYLQGNSDDPTILNLSKIRSLHNSGKILSLSHASYADDISGSISFNFLKGLIVSGKYSNANHYLSRYDYIIPNLLDNFSPEHMASFTLDTNQDGIVWYQFDHEFNLVCTAKLTKQFFRYLWEGNARIGKIRADVNIQGKLTTMDNVPSYKNIPLIMFMGLNVYYSTNDVSNLTESNLGGLSNDI